MTMRRKTRWDDLLATDRPFHLDFALLLFLTGWDCQNSYSSFLNDPRLDARDQHVSR